MLNPYWMWKDWNSSSFHYSQFLYDFTSHGDKCWKTGSVYKVLTQMYCFKIIIIIIKWIMFCIIKYIPSWVLIVRNSQNSTYFRFVLFFRNGHKSTIMRFTTVIITRKILIKMKSSISFLMKNFYIHLTAIFHWI